MKRRLAAAAVLGAVVLVAGCDRMSNKATPERLDTLVEDGIDGKKRTKAETRLERTLARANSIAGLNEQLGGSAVDNPRAVPLGELLHAAMEHNPDIRRAAQDINKADAQRLRAIFGYLPQISITLTQSTVDTKVISSDNAVFELGQANYAVQNQLLDVRQPLLDMSKIYAIQLASTARTGSEARYIAAVQKALYDTFDTYLKAAESRLRIEELQRRISSLGQQASGQGVLSESGLADDTARRSILTEQAKAESDLAIERSAYADALGKLAYLTGTAVSGVQGVSVPAGVSGTERRVSARQAVEAAQRNNPEMLAIAIAVVQADLGRKQAIAADFGPVLDLFATIESEDRGGSRFGGGSNTEETTTGVRLTIPVFNARGDGMRTLDANVDLRAAIVDYHATRRQLETEISMTLQRMTQLTAAIGRLQKAFASANANVNTERSRLESGESSEIVVASRQLLASQIRMEMETQRIEYLRAWARLQYLTGAMSADVSR